jgi:hypothetical protein
MSHPSSCRPIFLSQNGFAHISRCADCGSISVSFGPITFRVDEAGMRALLDASRQACATLDAHRAAELFGGVNEPAA